jgi:hypothetical protein
MFNKLLLATIVSNLILSPAYGSETPNQMDDLQQPKTCFFYKQTDKEKEEEASDVKPKKFTFIEDNGNENRQRLAEPFPFVWPPQMHEAVKVDVFAKPRMLKAPKIYNSSVEQEGFKFDGSFLFTELKESLPISDEESLRAKRLITSLKWQKRLAFDRCSHLRRATELSKLEDLQADEEFARRLNYEMAIDPFKVNGFVGLDIAGFRPERFASFKFWKGIHYRQSRKVKVNTDIMDEINLSFLRGAAQIPPVFNPNDYIDTPSAPSSWELPFDW